MPDWLLDVKKPHPLCGLPEPTDHGDARCQRRQVLGDLPMAGDVTAPYSIPKQWSASALKGRYADGHQEKSPTGFEVEQTSRPCPAPRR